jgi:demethylmenaquinone methyltransferase/2-methoxy-6-polyprenyl-1,4-benzoquinol methylase
LTDRSPTDDLSRTFGFQSVAPEERERRIRRVFDSVAPRYDLMNDLMSLGVHRLWKRRFAATVAPRAGEVIVDLAGGTGDIAALLAAPERTVLVCDPSLAMMRAGRARQLPAVGWLAGVGESLPLRDACVDAVTISFGIRNATDIGAALREILRVLRPGGRFLCLEFSQVDVPLLDKIYDAYSFTVIPAVGKVVTGDGQPYRYLVESIRTFPPAAVFADMITEAGFSRVAYRLLTAGTVAIHSGWRI